MVKNGLSFGTIQSFAVAYLIIWSISPPLEIDLVYRLLAVVAAAVWAGCWLFRENPISLDKNQIASIFFLFTVVGVTFISNGDFKGILKQIAFFMLVVSFIINSFYKKYNWDDLRWIIPVVLVLFIIFNYKTVQALIEDPTIARRIVRDDETIYVYLRSGVGGYSLVYPQVCISSALLLWTIKAFKKNKLYFIIGVLWCISFVQLISKAGYSIAIFTSAMGALLLFFYNGKSGIKAFVIAGILFAVIMLSIYYITDFRLWLLDIFDGTAVARKINDLVATGESGTAEGSIQARMTRYIASIKCIGRYPIIGALWRDNGGGHSAFLDIVAKFGIWGGWFFIKSFYFTPVYYKENIQIPQIKRLSNAVLVCLMIVTILNSATYAVYCTVLLFLPILYQEILSWEGAEVENTVDS